ncbi:hypothetical protein L1049_021678 [Liquidambar formosana]|uniref:Pentatricopeptide repeat-containing protein n=1 Tax=Liquidambar formosana TaxID=63359 RepID=A0AAP0RB71_LIQFO
MASLSKNPRLLLSRTLFSTLSSPQKLQLPTFRSVKSAIRSESNPDKLAELFSYQSSEFSRFRRHRPLFHLSVRKLSRSNRHDLIRRIIEHQKESLTDSPMLQSEGFWIRLIMLYSESGMVDEAMRTFDQMGEFKCNQSEKSLCALLTVFMNNGMFEKVHEVFHSVPLKTGITPGVKSHNLVLKAFCKENNVGSAKAWIEKMEKDDKVAPDINSYNVLLGAYLKNRDGSGFDGIVKEISKTGLEYNVTTYNYRISKFCKNKECARAKKLLDEMVSKGLKPNSASYNTVIDGFCRVGDFESAQKVLQSMVADGYVLPCSFTYYTLIRHMVEEGEFDSALEMCEEIIRRKWVPPFEAMEALVKGLIKMSKAKEAKEVVAKMKKRLKGPAVDSWGKIEAALPL